MRWVLTIASLVILCILLAIIVIHAPENSLKIGEVIKLSIEFIGIVAIPTTIYFLGQQEQKKRDAEERRKEESKEIQTYIAKEIMPLIQAENNTKNKTIDFKKIETTFSDFAFNFMNTSYATDIGLINFYIQKLMEAYQLTEDEEYIKQMYFRIRQLPEIFSNTVKGNMIRQLGGHFVENILDEISVIEQKEKNK